MDESRQSATTEISFMHKDEKQKKPEKKKNRRQIIIMICVIAVTLSVGWIGGSVLPMKGTMQLRQILHSFFGSSSGDKIDTVLDIMENDWYFAGDIDDIDQRLTDQALTGITTNDEDPHTAYFSKEESDSFTDSINRSYTGIGVEVDTSSDTFVITRVIPNSPAEEAGMMAGDILRAVDGRRIEGMAFSAVRKLIVGKEGTSVTVTAERDGREVDFTMKRKEVSDTVKAEMADDDTVYLQLYQFGQDTASDTKSELESLIGDKDSVSMILDLRNNGGGYLESVQALASLFIDKGDTVLKEEFADGTSSTTRAAGGKLTNIHNIVILVNDETASAAEVMTLALKQNRDDVTIVGNTTYGKGTVQQTVTFKDGTALHYTVARWLPKNGKWVNGKGIAPDEEVDLPDALTSSAAEMKEDQTCQYDDVADPVKSAQKYLAYLGYDVDRRDGYFSKATETALKQYETDHSLSSDGILSYDDYSSLYSSVLHDWTMSKTHDTQYNRAMEILNQ